MTNKELIECFTDEGSTLHNHLGSAVLEDDVIHIVENRKRLLGDSWYHIPKPLLLNVFQYLSAPDLIKAGLTCSTWQQTSTDELLWRDLLQKDFGVDTSTGIRPGQTSWLKEYKRLSYHTPHCQTSELRKHTDQVLHVSFAHNGTMFTTCSKDGYVVVWNSNHPVTIKHQKDMTKFCWKFTHFSQFNQSDTLLLVSGVHFGLPQSTSGEIAVFSLGDDLELQCRVLMKPYDICGAWYSDQHFLSGDVHRLGHLISQSVLWLNKASQETASEHIPIMNQMFRFYNCNGSSVRAAMFASCPVAESSLSTTSNEIRDTSSNSSSNHSGKDEEAYFEDMEKNFELDSKELQCGIPNLQVDEKYADDASDVSEISEASVDTELSDDDELCVQEDKFLIFTTGSNTFSPHQIGIKRIKPISFPRRMDPGLPFRERIANLNREYQPSHENPNEVQNEIAEGTEYDEVDHLIDLHGHIIGMGLSPDHRFLYVNARPWPPGYVVENPLMPPPCAQEIDIHVIDLASMMECGKVLRSHIAYTPFNECFFIALDVCDEFVASGAEDKHGYLWDRHYETCLNKYPHQDVVTCVAFNPKDSEMLVTVSDDCTVKVWHSKHRAKELGLDSKLLPKAHEVRKNCCGHRSVASSIRRPANGEIKRLMSRFAVQFGW
ncbi:F-box/WD repeat-containing protein 5 [Thrips palmi]|uniref:F-box/WD repeat-containing protein 5 n=1 Tax=Thrips palmi TaxID=161013 RepID=A0A6P8Y422_THRPL|nr:F-box/WD repeat-containing protein 5 [Thrips palmi]XP_034231120.1 F-box/WD repeat-containing protein 5 [Thrips palmi]